jgi:predicted PurR-regulated permease PerM
VLSVDDRTGNVLTTIGLFAAAAGAAYAARGTIVVFVLAMLFAYLLEPAVGWADRLLPSRSSSRPAAIAIVYLTGALLLAGGIYALAPTAARQTQRFAAAASEMRDRFADQEFLVQPGPAVLGGVERMAQAVREAAEHTGLLLTVPIIAIFFLNNRSALIDGTINCLARQRDRASVKRTVEQIDATLGQYARAQLTTAGLSVVFYSVSTTLLGFPYPLALGFLGGILEFIPMIGWIVAAAAMLTTGWVAQAHWIWMAGLILVWRLVQNFVISPRVVGNRVQMEPIAVFFALMAGGQIAGLLGVVLSVPAVAVLRILWEDGRLTSRRRLRSGIARAIPTSTARCQPDFKPG